MSRIDLWRWSATRVEIDHRAREARLRLEHLERLLIMRALPTRSWVRRVLHRRGSRFFNGGRVLSRSSKIDPAGLRRRENCSTATEWALSAKAAIGGMVHGPSAA
jgi:hypothetical protein